MAHKKAAWSAKNLRDSQPKFRGVKIFWWQNALAWNIIVRQCGNKYEAGLNTYVANDYSIHAKIDGVVRFSKTHKVRFDGRKYLKTVVNVDPCEAKAPTKKTPAKKVVEKIEKIEKVESAEKKAPAKKATTAKKTVAKKPTAKKTTKE